jgi:hypothetical protein
LVSLVPQRKGELSIEPYEEGVAVLLIRMHQHLGIGLCVKFMTKRLEFLPQLDVVEDFTVEHNPDGAILIRNRLIAGREVDDAKARVR